MSFDPATARPVAPEQPGQTSFNPATALPATRPETPLADTQTENPSSDAYWASVFSGLDGIAQRIDGGQDGPLSHLDSLGANGRELQAQAATSAYLSSRGFPTDFSTYPSVATQYARSRYGWNGNEIRPSELYSLISSSLNPNRPFLYPEPEGEPEIKPWHWSDEVAADARTLRQKAGNFWKSITKPIHSLPSAPPNLPDSPLLPFGLSPALVGGVYNGAIKPLVESLESPVGIASAGFAPSLASAKTASLAARAAFLSMGGAFTSLMARQVISAAPEVKAILADPQSSHMQKVEAVSAEVSASVQTVLGALGTVHEIAPEILRRVHGNDIPSVPGNLIYEAGSVADPEKKEAIVQAANELADAIGTHPAKVKSESPAESQSLAQPAKAKSLPTAKGKATDSTSIQGEPDDADTYGIAARVTQKRAASGKVEEIEPGKGIGSEASVEKGRELLKAGSSPTEALERFERTGAIKADDVALVRAEGERLAQAAGGAAEKFGPKSPEYLAASKLDSDWLKRIKPMQTEWARIGAAQQGETDIDTGSFHSMHRAFREIAGRDFTPEETEHASGLAEENKKASSGVNESLGQIKAVLGSGKAEANPVWERAKELLDAGEEDFGLVRQKLADETGLPIAEINRQLAKPKRLRKMTNELYVRLARRRLLADQSRQWLKNAAMPGWQRAMNGIPRAFFAMKIFGHGTVGMITHAGINVFDPTEWAEYWPNFARQYKLLGWHDRGAYHEMAMEDLRHEKNYVTARRAGLANSADRSLDDYQRGVLGKIGLTGNRGFDALKLYRQARFSRDWERMPPSLQTPEYARVLADSINHSTGYVRFSPPKGSNVVVFAPKLELSRWAFLVGDPSKDAKTFLNWANAPAEERAIALSNLRKKSLIAATYIGLLAANEGLMRAAGSDQKLNLSNTRASDFMAFKGFGYNFSIVSPMIGSIRYLANLFHIAAESRRPAERKDTRFQEIGQVSATYARGKLSPFASFLTDVISQADYQNRPLPFSNDPVPAYLRRDGIHRYTYAEWIENEASPIPYEPVIREIWSNQGMSQSRISHWLGILATAAVEGGTGARMAPDPDQSQNSSLKIERLPRESLSP